MTNGNSGFWLTLAMTVCCAVVLSGCGSTPPRPSSETEAAIAAAPETLSYSNKWRIEVSEGARSDGEIVFQVTPLHGEGQLITVPISQTFGENRVAKEIAGVFKDRLDHRRFQVERDDREDVLVKKRHGEADFSLRVISSTVAAVRIRVQKE